MTDKDTLRDAYLEGFREGFNVEDVDSHTINTAKSQFNRWYDINDIGETNE